MLMNSICGARRDAGGHKIPKASLTAARSRPTSERTKRPKPGWSRALARYRRLRRCRHPAASFRVRQVGRRERFTLPQLVQHDVVLMRLEEMPRLLLEAGEVGFADLRQFVLDAVADLVGEVRIDDRLPRLFDVLHQIAQPQSNEFEQRNGDAFPPLIRLNLFDQHRLLRDRRNAGLVLQRRSDLQQLLLQRVETLRAFQQRQLQREHQQIEAFIRAANTFEVRADDLGKIGPQFAV